jgi:HlyD family secretion protein
MVTILRLVTWATVIGGGFWVAHQADYLPEIAQLEAAQPSAAISSPQFRLATVERRVIVDRVSATGTLNPVALVSVSSQVSGQIRELYADFNDEVRQGDPIALIDPTTFEIAVDVAEAELDMARGAVAMQEAMVDRMMSDLQTLRHEHAAALAQVDQVAALAAGAEAEAQRREALGAIGSAADRERAVTARLAAQAQLRSAEASAAGRGSAVASGEAQLRSLSAQLVNMQAAVRQRQAYLRQATIDLERTVVRAPVDGRVIIRNIEIGQTVAVSLQAPVLFTIAQDLREMRVNTAIAEAQIGRIREGQRFEFHVDGYRDRLFVGEVTQVRLQPQTSQNVVNYTVVASAPNPDQILLPGMTATANIIVSRSEPVLAVPSNALRFRPPGVSRAGEDRIYVLRGGEAVAVPVQLGATDSGFTSVQGDGLEEGDQVILGVADQRGAGPEPSGTRSFLGLF